MSLSRGLAALVVLSGAASSTALAQDRPDDERFFVFKDTSEPSIQP